MIHVSPSILSADVSNLKEQILSTRNAGADYLHLDVMDGMFVPSISFGMPIIKGLRDVTDQIFDVHMMVQAPERYIKEMADCGADWITIHAEATPHADRAIQMIHECGKKAGIALNPSTPLSALEWVVSEVDMVLVMGVNPGFGGQKLIPYTVDKVRVLHQMLLERGLRDRVDIQVDGGVTLSNMRDILDAGANIIVAGSAIFKGDAEANAKAFMEIVKEYK